MIHESIFNLYIEHLFGFMAFLKAAYLVKKSKSIQSIQQQGRRQTDKEGCPLILPHC